MAFRTCTPGGCSQTTELPIKWNVTKPGNEERRTGFRERGTGNGELSLDAFFYRSEGLKLIVFEARVVEIIKKQFSMKVTLHQFA